MRRVSLKRQRLMRTARPLREEYLAAHGRCIWCGAWDNIAVHEISRGALRGASLDKPFCWLPLCWTCNSGDFNDKGKWPEIKQLALKYLRDFANYDLKKYNELVNTNAPNRITEREVQLVVKRLMEIV